MEKTKYRVITDKAYPRTRNSAHNTKYYHTFIEAQTAYMHSFINQLMYGTHARIALEIRRLDGKYEVWFDSYMPGKK